MIENIRLSFQGLWSHKMRSILTMLGIIIGIAAVMAIVSTIKGTNDQIREQLIGSGKNTVSITLQQGGNSYMSDYSTDRSNVPAVSEDMRSKILSLKEVENITAYRSTLRLLPSFVRRRKEAAIPSMWGSAMISATPT